MGRGFFTFFLSDDGAGVHNRQIIFGKNGTDQFRASFNVSNDTNDLRLGAE